jgi:hypothetical protein
MIMEGRNKDLVHKEEILKEYTKLVGKQEEIVWKKKLRNIWIK